MAFVLEHLADGSLSTHDDWDDAWDYARRITGGMPAGNVLLYEATRYDPSTFYNEFARGRRMLASEWAKVRPFVLTG